MAQAASKDFKNMVILRVLSGAAEAIADPAFMLITTSFYRRSEQPSRYAFCHREHYSHLSRGAQHFSLVRGKRRRSSFRRTPGLCNW